MKWFKLLIFMICLLGTSISLHSSNAPPGSDSTTTVDNDQTSFTHFDAEFRVADACLSSKGAMGDRQSTRVKWPKMQKDTYTKVEAHSNCLKPPTTSKSDKPTGPKMAGDIQRGRP